MRAAPLAAVVLALTLAVACRSKAPPIYTLYRSAAVGDTARLHVATFDADDPDSGYNHDTCEQTRELYQIQPTNRARFWCEVGRFHEKR